MRFLSRDRWAVSRYPTSISNANRRRDFLVALDAPGEAWPEHMIRSRLRRPISAVYVIYDRHSRKWQPISPLGCSFVQILAARIAAAQAGYCQHPAAELERSCRNSLRLSSVVCVQRMANPWRIKSRLPSAVARTRIGRNLQPVLSFLQARVAGTMPSRAWASF